MIEGFEPIINQDSRILILGTMPSVESIRNQEYYGNKRNQFWKILFSLSKTKYIESYQERKGFLLRNHIAIWDVLKSCDREGSSDSKIRNPKANDFTLLFTQYPKIKSIYFNGKTAEKLYRTLVEKTIGNNDIRLIALPSTSPANTMQFEKKLEEWEIIVSCDKNPTKSRNK